MAGWYELKQNAGGKWCFTLKAGNGQVILTSEAYESRGAAENGMASVRKNSPLDERYERKVAKDGSPYFCLKAGNHQIIGMSQMYGSEAARDHGIASVKSNGPTTSIKTPE
jgi:uncharacterized protein YegP (UPF0339 family)